MELLQEMLKINPDKRDTLENLILSRSFFSVRNPQMEQHPPFQINPGIDRIKDYNYKDQSFKTLSTQDLLKIL